MIDAISVWCLTICILFIVDIKNCEICGVNIHLFEISCSWLQELLSQIYTRTLRNPFQRREFNQDSLLFFIVYFLLVFMLMEVGVLCRIKMMYNHVSERSGLKAPLIADDVYEIIMKVNLFRKLCLLVNKWSRNLKQFLFVFGFRMRLVWIVRSFMIGTLTMITLASRRLRGLTS